MLEYCLIATAFGPIGLLWSERGLRRLQLPDVEAPAAHARLLHGIEAAEADPPAGLEPSIVKLQRYFAGVRTELDDIPIDLEGVPDFFGALYLEMRTLGWGETVTYGELAARVGAPGAARAVGQAMGRNRLPVIVPCHRVLASQGRPGGFSAPGGVATKLRLLDMEGVRLTRPSPQLAFAF
ncbi:MAG TPA: methylated-DNA--[protein]-cysteine S-methyltransferase [Devosia sp.]|nr:methylated-DNA--[protein]-cysteine S-methyltransferase [Devosia sp.]